MEKLLTYEEVLELTENHTKYLLLGNGFSMSYNKDRFSFTSLLESAVKKGLIQENSSLYNIFKKFETKDFEEVVKLLETSLKVLEEYGINDLENKEKITNDSESLKIHLVDIITNNHPEKITDISDREYLTVSNFLNNYHKIYTLNYDLLLYWSTIKLLDFLNVETIKKKNLNVTDGFREGVNSDIVFGNDSSPQEIYYLHGALHIFDEKHKIIKNTFSRTNIPLKEQTLKNLKKEIYPIFVSEGTSEQKKAKIIHNAYLNHCYKSLNSIGKKDSSLIVFGTLLKSNDEHIREAIINNKVENIYFGVSKIEQKKDLESFIDILSKLKKPKKVIFYDYKTVNIWR